MAQKRRASVRKPARKRKVLATEPTELHYVGHAEVPDVPHGTIVLEDPRQAFFPEPAAFVSVETDDPPEVVGLGRLISQEESVRGLILLLVVIVLGFVCGGLAVVAIASHVGP